MPTKAKHQLNLNNRIYIQSAINLNKSAAEISDYLNVARQTIYREIKRNSFAKERRAASFSSDCKLKYACPHRMTLKTIGYQVCAQKCDLYEKVVCNKLKKFPYICNSCEIKNKCMMNKYYYEAGRAQTKAHEILVTRRQGIHISNDDFSYIDNIISPLLKQGQSLHHILTTHREIKVCEVTIRN